MVEQSKRLTDRREFFRTAARYLALGGMALLGAKLATREAPCTGEGLCRRCAALAGCPLPQALATKAGPGIGNRKQG